MNLISLMTGWGVPARFVKPLLAFVALLALAGFLWAAVAIHDSNVVKQHDAAANAAVIAKVTPANDKAADQRATDAITNARNEQELTDAVHSTPDARPSAGVTALGCARLRRQAKDRSKLPTECRP